MIRITCTSCQKPLSLDETKLPMGPFAFPCPVCKAKLSVDRRNLEGAAAPPPSQPAPSAADDDDHTNEFGAKALIVGNDHPAIRQSAKLVGFLPIVHADAAKAREFFNQEQPQIVFLNPAQMGPPPLEHLAPIMSVTPVERRKSFYILVADNLRTLDGNAAFLYGVNLVVATKDLGQFPQIFRDAQVAHERLYAGMNAVLREKQLS
jgi:hypothetical protein